MFLRKNEAHVKEKLPLLHVDVPKKYDYGSDRRPDNESRNNYTLGLLPNEYNCIDDMLRQLKLRSPSRRCMVIGLDHLCRVYPNLHLCWNDIVVRLNRWKRRSIDKNLQHEPVWIDIQGPTVEDMKTMEHIFRLHPLTIEDVSMGESHEKWEIFDEYFFAILNAQVDQGEDFLEKTPLSVMVFEDFVLTVHSRPIRILELVLKRIAHEFEIEEVLENISSSSTTHTNNHADISPSAINPTHTPLFPTQSSSPYRYKYEFPEFLSKFKGSSGTVLSKTKRTAIPSADWVLYALFDSIVDIYVPIVESLYHEVYNIDEMLSRLASTEHRDMLRRIGVTNKSIVELRRLVQPKTKIARFMITRSTPLIGESVRIYMRDVLDHLSTCDEKLEHSKEILSQIHSTYLTRVQLGIAQTSRKRTEFINQIGIGAFVLGPVSLITSLMGVNVPVPGGDSNAAWFYGVLAALVVLCFFIVLVMRTISTEEEKPNKEYFE